MPDTIYYVGAKLSIESSFLLGGPTGLYTKNPHVTLVYSRKWFPYKEANFFPLILEPSSYKTYEYLRGQQPVLTFFNSRFYERYIELRNLGATSDFEEFKMHISLANKLPLDSKLPDFSIILEKEYYRTWIEGEN